MTGESPGYPDRMLRGLLDRVLVALTLLVLRWFFRRVEVDGRERLPKDRPVLVVANHSNGLIDPVILVHTLGRVPRFIAKAALWRPLWVRPFLAAAGMIPVARPQDQPDTSENRRTFSTSHDVLRKGGTVGLFPEGIAHDEPHLAPIRTGAARIALGARAAGAEGLAILPIGLAFDDKIGLRSRALARVGEPIDLDAELDDIVGADGSASEDDPEAVRALTSEIEQRLRAVAPDYADRREARVLARAAEIWHRSRGGSRLRRQPVGEVPLSDQERLARRLRQAPEATRGRIRDAVARYNLDLDLTGLRDHQIAAGYTPLQVLGGFVRTALIVALLAPLWVPGLIINVVPYQLASLSGLAMRNPVMKGTLRVFVALAVFPITWAVVLLLLGVDTLWMGAIALALMPLAGVVAAGIMERLVRAVRAWRGWLGLVERRALLDEVRVDRDRLLRLVDELVEAPEGREVSEGRDASQGRDAPERHDAPEGGDAPERRDASADAEAPPERADASSTR